MKLMPFALMVGANMQQAILFGAKLRNADMTIVNLIETNIQVSELISADLLSPTLRASVSWVSTSPAQRLATSTNVVLIWRVRKALG